MDYEKKYNDALKRAKAVMDVAANQDEARGIATTIFPELRESEDERIWKAIDEIMKLDKAWEIAGEHGLTAADIRRWVKKQKEQKPAEKQDYSGLNDLERAILRGFLSAGVENVPVTIIKETAKECLAQMKPAGWSEEDERILERAIHIIVEYSDIDEKESEIVQKWLKSLYLQPKQGLILTEEQEKKFGHLFSRPSWKPSEKQMNCLCAAVDAAIRKHNESVSGYEPARILKSLYEDLKKL